MVFFFSLGCMKMRRLEFFFGGGVLFGMGDMPVVWRRRVLGTCVYPGETEGIE